MKCLRCDKESTGILVQLCDDDFDQWEREVAANPSKADVGPVDARLKYKHAGGTVPDDVEAVMIRVIPISPN